MLALAEDDVIKSTSFASVVPNVAKKFFTKGTLNSVIMMITGVQLVVHSPLLNIQFPGNAFVIYEELIGMVTYEFLPTSDIFPHYFDFPDRGSLNDRFERLDYGSFYSIMMLGCIFLAIIWMLFLYIVFLVLLVCRKLRWPRKVLRVLWKTLFWK